MQTLVIHTQYKENYGFPDWDGKGECPVLEPYGFHHFVTDSSIKTNQSDCSGGYSPLDQTH